MLTLEGLIRVNFTPENEDDAIDTLNRLGFRRIFTEPIKDGLEQYFGELDDFSVDLLHQD